MSQNIFYLSYQQKGTMLGFRAGGEVEMMKTIEWKWKNNALFFHMCIHLKTIQFLATLILHSLSQYNR